MFNLIFTAQYQNIFNMELAFLIGKEYSWGNASLFKCKNTTNIKKNSKFQ